MLDNSTTISNNNNSISDLIHIFSSQMGISPELVSATISDRRTPVNIMNWNMAKKLELLIEPVPLDKIFTIVFDKK